MTGSTKPTSSRLNLFLNFNLFSFVYSCHPPLYHIKFPYLSNSLGLFGLDG